MKVVILAGGFGTRINEESAVRPKPMIEIGEMPIIWHIMKNMSVHGHNEFIICAGYKQYFIKDWFANYMLHTSDVTFDFTDGAMRLHDKKTEPWKVSVVDTGYGTETTGRINRIHKYVGDEPFILTYGDAVSDIDINKVIAQHEQTGHTVTLSVYHEKQTKGVVKLNKTTHKVEQFREKSDKDSNTINIGYMVCNPEIFEYTKGLDDVAFEKGPLVDLSQLGKLGAYEHDGFWKCMDTLKEKQELESLWYGGNAPWKTW